MSDGCVQADREDARNRMRCVDLDRGLAASPRAFLLTAAGLALTLPSGCSGIWNASDLARRVKDRAVAQGCLRETIQLEDWYSETAEGNIWRGTCRDAQGDTRAFGIDVDPVWTPSKSPN